MAAAQGQDPFDSSGFVALRLANGAAAAGSSTNRFVTTQVVAIDDFGGCLPSPDSSYSATCSAMRTLAAPSDGSFPCTLPTNAEVGRLSSSADGQLVTWYCMRQPAGTTLQDTGNVDPFNGDGVVAVMDYLGESRRDGRG